MDTNTVKWFLSELEVVEPEQLETGEVEVICEDSEGREGVTYFSVTELAKHSSKLIETLEAENHHLSTELNEAKTKISNAIDVLNDDMQCDEDIPYNVACALGAE